MAEVAVLEFRDKVRLDPDKLGTLYYQLGAQGAEDVVCRAMEELAVRLTDLARVDDLTCDVETHLRDVRMVAAIADQVGMTALARAARNLGDCLLLGDRNALAACSARLDRVGDMSLLEIWDCADLSV